MNHQRDLTHETLMARFKTSLDQAAFEQLVLDYASGATVVANQMLGDWALAEDATQEAFVRVIKKRSQYITSSPFSRWFYAILRNICTDMLRKRQRDQKLAKQLSNEIANSTRNKPPFGRMALLDSLPFYERSVLELRVVHSMPFKEISAALDISEEAAKKRAQRGLRKLRQKLSGRGRAERRAV
jgi:DNA-directed RNA polymerase specialized sigma24 family protein